MPEGDIILYVFDYDTGEMIPDAQVFLNPENAKSITLKTDIFGQARQNDLPGGELVSIGAVAPLYEQKRLQPAAIHTGAVIKRGIALHKHVEESKHGHTTTATGEEGQHA